jgi:hypothetical protein
MTDRRQERTVLSILLPCSLVAALLACGGDADNDLSAGPVCTDDVCPADASADTSPAPERPLPDADPVPRPWVPEPGATLNERDSDGDGIPDRVEGTDDADGDGFPNYLDLDSDGDGIPDAIEGVVDTDFDGIPDFLDLDSDGDGIPDAIEGAVDADGDGVLNFRDIDADGDDIWDRWEGIADPDGDGIPNFLDLDSDGDGWSDADEYGRGAGTGLPPLDTDIDGVPDFLDLDSDGDGLADEEELGCPESTERLLADSDDDGYPDLVEVVFSPPGVNKACDPDTNIAEDVDFYFELRYLDNEEDAPLDFLPAVRRGDVVFNMDTTGSMGGSIETLKRTLSSALIPALTTQLEDVGIGVTAFDDFPCNGHGSGQDLPFHLLQRITTSDRDAQAGVNALRLRFGSDQPESGIESLYQIATGVGRSNRSGCAVDRPLGAWLVPPFDPAVGFRLGAADGTIGGVGFRDGSAPVIVHITDAPSHAKGESVSSGAPYQYGATRVETQNSLRAIGARIIGVLAGGNSAQARDDLEGLTTVTGSAVRPCAWGAARPAGCAATECCTGPDRTGRPPINGLCPLVYDARSDGTGLAESIVSGTQVLLESAAIDLTARVRLDPDTLADEGLDTSCFLRAVRPIRALPPPGDCAPQPVVADLDRDGIPDGFSGVVPGSFLEFEVTAFNDCYPPDRRPRVFLAWIDIVESRGAAVYDTRLVTILVPPDFKR